uniref:Aminopeptidase n=1 Tax=Lepeophtheirus salmonis TaxID=72036 RepID=A0A0K2TW69_LEPSM
MKTPFLRLRPDAVPSHYDLFLKTCYETWKSIGRVDVFFSLETALDVIEMNAMEMEIKSAKIRNGPTSVCTRMSVDHQTLQIEFPCGSLLPGEHVLEIEFVSEISKSLKGFYRCGNGSDPILCTQFESTSARLCFPCWDEPAFKATFSISVEAPKGKTVLCNTQIEKEVPGEGSSITYHFEKTPIMSTYLVAIVIGNFDMIEAKTKQNVLVRVFAPLGKSSQAQLTLDTTIKSIEFYNDFFKIDYPLSKCDVVGVPEFSALAMENWGLIIFRDSYILYDPNVTSAHKKRDTIATITHEIAHQWFGNLVTMEWWTHLWLNEGFASFMGNICAMKIYPEMDFNVDFVVYYLKNSLKLDALKNSHPIEMNVEDPDEVEEIFDEISYDKGCSILRMLYHFMGDEEFRNGLCHYFQKFAHKNTVTEHLWQALETTSFKGIEEMMFTWVNQIGFPLVSVSSHFENKSLTLTLSQEKFNIDGSKSADGEKWIIPVSVITENDQKPQNFLMEDNKFEIVVNNPGQWFKLNSDCVGFYHVNYDIKDLNNLKTPIASKLLGEIDRFNLWNDIFSLVEGGKMSTVSALKFLDAFKEEDTYSVWNNIIDSCHRISSIIMDQTYYPNYLKYVVNVMTNIYNQVGWEALPGESEKQKLLRPSLIKRMGLSGHEGAIEEARRRFDLHFNGSKNIEANLRNPIYSIVMAHGDKNTLKQMLTMYRKEDQEEEKERIASVLGFVRDKDVLMDVWDFCTSSEVRTCDSVLLLASFSTNIVGRQLFWDLFKKNNSFFLMNQPVQLYIRLVELVSSGLYTYEKADEVEAYFKENNISHIQRTIDRCVEKIRMKAKWFERDSEEIKKFFQ